MLQKKVIVFDALALSQSFIDVVRGMLLSRWLQLINTVDSQSLLANTSRPTLTDEQNIALVNAFDFFLSFFQPSI
jgi:hypothetical protein